MKSESLSDKDIVQFLEYYNQPDWFGIYVTVEEGAYPIYKLNLEEDQLWLMIADFLETYQIDNKGFNHNTAFFRSAIKKGWAEKIKRAWLSDTQADGDMTVAFLAAVARRGVWDERIHSAALHCSGQESTA